MFPSWNLMETKRQRRRRGGRRVLHAELSLSHVGPTQGPSRSLALRLLSLQPCHGDDDGEKTALSLGSPPRAGFCLFVCVFKRVRIAGKTPESSWEEIPSFMRTHRRTSTVRCFWEPGLRLETDCRLMPDARARSRRKERAPRTEVRSALGLKPGTKLSGQLALGKQRAARATVAAFPRARREAFGDREVVTVPPANAGGGAERN